MSTATVSVPGTRVGSEPVRPGELPAGAAAAAAISRSRTGNDRLERIGTAVQPILEGLRERAETRERIAVLRWPERPLRLEQLAERRAAGEPGVVVAGLDSVRVRREEAELVGVDLEGRSALAADREAGLPVRRMENSVVNFWWEKVSSPRKSTRCPISCVITNSPIELCSCARLRIRK
jgi:hypothetical protein